MLWHSSTGHRFFPGCSDEIYANSVWSPDAPRFVSTEVLARREAASMDPAVVSPSWTEGHELFTGEQALKFGQKGKGHLLEIRP